RVAYSSHTSGPETATCRPACRCWAQRPASRPQVWMVIHSRGRVSTARRNSHTTPLGVSRRTGSAVRRPVRVRTFMTAPSTTAGVAGKVRAGGTSNRYRPRYSGGVAWRFLSQLDAGIERHGRVGAEVLVEDRGPGGVGEGPGVEIAVRRGDHGRVDVVAGEQ